MEDNWLLGEDNLYHYGKYSKYNKECKVRLKTYNGAKLKNQTPPKKQRCEICYNVYKKYGKKIRKAYEKDL